MAREPIKRSIRKGENTAGSNLYGRAGGNTRDPFTATLKVHNAHKNANLQKTKPRMDSQIIADFRNAKPNASTVRGEYTYKKVIKIKRDGGNETVFERRKRVTIKMRDFTLVGTEVITFTEKGKFSGYKLEDARPISQS